jgi:hypothetical protein
MKKQFKTRDLNDSLYAVFLTEEKAREFIQNSKQIPIKHDDGSLLDDHDINKAMELANYGLEKRVNHKQTRVKGFCCKLLTPYTLYTLISRAHQRVRVPRCHRSAVVPDNQSYSFRLFRYGRDKLHIHF